MVAVGASLGGLVSALFGRDVAFVMNSVSFFASAALITQMRVPPRPPHARAEPGWHGIADGIKYMRLNRHVARIAFIKGGWAVIGGALLLLAVLGERVFPIGGSSDAGIGLLYASRGIGATIGSFAIALAARRAGVHLTRWIGPCYIAAGIAYATLGYAPSIWFAAATVVVAHSFGSMLWVASTVLLQTTVPDEFRGRVFATELIALALVQAASTYLTALALDDLHTPPRLLAVAVGAALLAQGLVHGEGRQLRTDKI
jgi:predicted MFS family arabinose efflux permease